MTYPKIPPEVRFSQRFVVAGNGCWIWTRHTDKDGYGILQVAKKVTVKAHRFSYTRFKGSIPTGAIVCHTCDNPSCVNPGHLYAGSHADNTRDKMLRGRHRVMINPCPGERNGRAKLTNAEVIEIRALHASFGTKALAKKFALHRTTIQRIVRREHWAHVA
jgi:hypothetical protein